MTSNSQSSQRFSVCKKRKILNTNEQQGVFDNFMLTTTMIFLSFFTSLFVPRATCSFILHNKNTSYQSACRLVESNVVPEPWSCIATLDSDSEDEGNAVNLLIVDKQHTVSSENGIQYSLSSPREWMEAIEAQDRCHGAYTVLRCDLKSSTDTGNPRVWGQPFHEDRMSSSFSALCNNSYLSASSIAVATDASRRIIDTIINCAKKSLVFQGSEDEIKVIMITLLWQKSKTNPNDILVRGHAFSSNLSSIPCQYNPLPMKAIIAIPRNTAAQLPSRYDHTPRAKLSSWCSERRPLEGQYKTSDVGEVILSRPREQKHGYTFELLEGLTSNLFIVYTDGTIRTPIDTVLDGYARSLVIESAKRNGLKLSNDPILLEDAKNNLWAEAFVTSSIRIIIPVGNIMIPDYTIEDGFRFQEVWSESPLSALPWNIRRWELLYKDILYNL